MRLKMRSARLALGLLMSATASSAWVVAPTLPAVHRPLSLSLPHVMEDRWRLRAAVADAGGVQSDKSKGLTARLGRQFSLLRNASKADLASMGITSFFSYGIVSNFNSVILIAFTWASYRRANPLLSPLSDTAIIGDPLTWFPLKKAFIAFYVGYYATVGSIMRPFRFGIAIALAPKLEKLYRSIQNKLGVSKAVAIFLVTLLFNVGASMFLLITLIYAFSFALGVPPLPPAI